PWPPRVRVDQQELLLDAERPRVHEGRGTRPAGGVPWARITRCGRLRRRVVSTVAAPIGVGTGHLGHPGGVAEWVFSIVDGLGAAGVGLLILLENIVPPIPSEVILPLAGSRARTGALNVVAVWPAATAGSVLGPLPPFVLGARPRHDRPPPLPRH